MLSGFRSFINSTAGKIAALLVLVVIALAFAAGDITGLGGGTAALSNTELARVGDTRITEAEARERIQVALQNARRENPGVDMNQLIAADGVERVIDQMIDELAMAEFADEAGMAVGDRLIDGQIAGIPAFHDLNGKFDQKKFDQVMEEQRVNPKGLRDDIRRSTLTNWLVAPTIGASQVPSQLALPYASLLMERRHGEIALIPTLSMNPGPMPDDKALATFYSANRNKYIVPERRVIRYARVTPELVKAQATPSEAEIAKAYRDAGTRFAATEKRTLRQVIVGDQATANTLANQVQGGTALDQAARAAGLEPTALNGIEKAALTRQANAAIANAAFAAARGAVVGPLRSPLGWVVMRVESIDPVPGRTLDQARAELTAELTQRKTAEALAAIQEKLDEGINASATFDELMADAKLSAERSPALLANGRNPDAPETVANPALQPLLKAGFEMEQGDDPQLVPTGPDGSFAVVALDRVVASTPKPLADIRQIVTRDYMLDKAFKAAREAAANTVANLNRGTPMAQALAAAGVKSPNIQQVALSREEMARSGQQPPPPVELMFSMVEKKAKLLQDAQGGGYFVVWLDKIDRGDASKRPELIYSTRQGLGGVIGREYSEQFVAAIKKQLKVSKNDAAIKKLRADLAGGGSAVAN